MSKYTFRCVYDNTIIELQTEEVYLPDLLVQIKGFLQASGFTIDGELEVVEQEDYSTMDEEV